MYCLYAEHGGSPVLLCIFAVNLELEIATTFIGSRKGFLMSDIIGAEAFLSFRECKSVCSSARPTEMLEILLSHI